MSDIEIEIDGKKLPAKANAMVIEVADEAGIYIPRFCYHKHLSIAANCRMCLVEVEKSPKTLPACATPVTAGMKVFTRSPKALAAQKAVMEFLLINHPLDCPICDQGGECELQDLSLGFGSAESFYTEGKRSVFDQDIGPLIETEMTRCIQCTRCVRFGAEIAGMPELGATGRGEHMEIGTYVEHAMKSEVSGNVIDICPVGALTSKPFRFSARAWELDQRPAISPHDCVGTNLNVHLRYGKVMRMVPRENSNINETWISDRDRFSYEGLYHPDRVRKPRIKKMGAWQEVDWQTALEVAARGLQKVITEKSADQIGALASPSATLEEFYLLQKLLRSLGSSHIDHRLRQTDFSLPISAANTLSFAGLEDCDTVLLIGCNIQKEAPSAFLRLRKASLKGAAVLALNMVDYPFSFTVSEKEIVAPDEMVAKLADIAKNGSTELAKKLQMGKKVCLVLGSGALNHPDAGLLQQLSALIAKEKNAHLLVLTEGCNAAGAWLAGAVPKTGLDAQAMLANPRAAYVLLNVEPDVDCANPVAATAALQQAECVVALSLFKNAVLEEHADVILPIAAFTETSGTYVNTVGEWQRFQGVASAFEESRPAWKILRVLGNLLHLSGFDYESTEEVHADVQTSSVIEKSISTDIDWKKIKSSDRKKLYRIGTTPLYAVDGLVRRAKALQAAQIVLEGDVNTVRIHPALGAQLAVKEGAVVTVKQKNDQVRLPVLFDESLPERGVYIASGVPATVGLSELFGEVEILG